MPLLEDESMSTQFAGETSVYWKWCHAWQLPFNGIRIVLLLSFFFGGSSEYGLEMAKRLAVAMCWCRLLECAISPALSHTNTLSHTLTCTICVYLLVRRTCSLVTTDIHTCWHDVEEHWRL